MLARHSLPLLCSHGPREAGEHLSQFLAGTRVTSAGRFTRPAYVGGVHIGAFSIAVIELRAAVCVEAVGSGDDTVMVLCLRGSGEMHVNGHVMPVRRNHGILVRPVGALRAQFSDDCVRWVVRMESRLAAAPADAEGACFDLANPALRPWLEYLHCILSSRALIAAIASDRCVSERVEELMATLLHRICLPAIRDDTLDLAVSRDVRRAEAYVRANLADDIDLADIAKAAGVSERTLQASFKRCHKVSPMHFLRNLRLDIARERILSGATVADAAFDSGFSHQGRFAKYYGERFGELPSSGAAKPLFSF
jgi:AraC-like DNA-binding protein